MDSESMMLMHFIMFFPIQTISYLSSYIENEYIMNVIGFTIYFLPTIIGLYRDIDEKKGIIITNIFIGAFNLFWLPILLYSLFGNKMERDNNGF